MPNYIKYTTGTESNALKKGNFYIGTGDEAKGPTSQTGFYNGPTPGDYQYTVYVNQDNDIPLAYTARNDNELVTLTNTISGQSFTTINQCFAYYEGQSDKMCINKPIDGIVTDGLVLNLDAGNVISYPASGSTWEDISGNNNSGSLTNGPTFSSGNGGSIVFDGVDDNVNVGVLNTINNASSLTIGYWMKKSASNKDMVVGSQVSSNTNGIWLQWYLDGNIYFSPRNGSNTSITYALSYDSNWKYLVGVYQNSSGSIYVNGSLVATGINMPSSLSSTAGNDFTIGNLRNLFPSTGNISAVKVYNRALSAEEILQNYNATKARFEAIEPVTDGLVLNLDAGNPNSYLDGVSGTTWSDVSGEENDGTLTNGTAFTSSDGGAMVFDGADDYVNISSNTLSRVGGSNHTINTFVNNDSINEEDIVGNRNTSTFQAGDFLLMIYNQSANNQGGFRGHIWTSTGASNTLDSVYPSGTGSWKMGTQVVDWDENKIKLYQNGSPAGEKIITGSKPTSTRTNTYIGVRNPSYSAAYFQGSIAQTQIYNQALTQFEVYQNFNAIKGRFGIPDIVTDGLVLNLDAGNPNSYLSGSSGTTWTDVSGEGNDGTLTNGASYSNGAIEFDGTNDLITTTLTSNTIFTSSFTVSCWFNADAIGSFPRIFNKANNGSTFEAGGFGSFFNDSNGTYQIYCRIDNNLIDTSAATFSLGVWNNLTTVFKNGEATVYLNGGSGITGTNASAQLSDITTSDDFVIGNIHGANRPFDGKIAITMIYSKELSQAENTQNFNALRGRYGI